MPVSVEFFGIPRQRAGIEATSVEGETLGEVLAVLARRYPAFAEECLESHRLKKGHLANINGERFTTDSATPLVPGDCVLILSADVGG